MTIEIASQISNLVGARSLCHNRKNSTFQTIPETGVKVVAIQ
jgi:hypothetical protein